MKNIINYLNQGGILFVLLCVSLVLNQRFGYITLIGILSVFIILTVTIKRRIDKGALCIFLYVLFYISFSSFNGFVYGPSTLLLYGLAPFLFYQIGGELTKRFRTENRLLMAWLLIIICYCLDIFSITVSNIITTGQIINPARVFSFTKDGTMELAATLVGLPMDLGMIGLPMFMLVNNKLLKYTFLTLFFFSLLTTFHLLNRTGIVVAILCFLGVIGYKSRKDLRLLVGAIILIVLVFFVLVKTGIINSTLIEFYTERNEDISTMGSRLGRWEKAIGNLFTQPFGWINDGQIYYIHNMWLDVARISGLLPFLLLTYFSTNSFFKAFRLIKRYDNAFTYMMLGLNICFFASCFVEPIYGGTHLMLYCMLWGTENALFEKSYTFY